MDSKRLAIIVVGIIVLVAIVIGLGPRLFQAMARKNVTDRCSDLQARIAAARAANDMNLARTLESELRLCNADAIAMGVDIDLSDSTLSTCEATGEQIVLNWDHYRGTAWSDPVKRNNTRTSMLTLGNEMARCYARAVEETSTVAGAKRIKTSITKRIGEATERFNCYKNDGPGCGRFGLNEDHGNDKAQQENDRVIQPLRDALAACEIKIVRLEMAEQLRAAGVATPAVPT
jgi:hypothetical protein